VFRIPVRPKLAALKTMESNNENNDAATSEVGSGSLPNTSIDPWRVLMEMQNKNFIELVKALKPTASETTNNNAVVLPKFNADLAGADASAWCATVNIILAENHIKGSALVMALSAALEAVRRSGSPKYVILTLIGLLLRNFFFSVLPVWRHQQLWIHGEC